MMKLFCFLNLLTVAYERRTTITLNHVVWRILPQWLIEVEYRFCSKPEDFVGCFYKINSWASGWKWL